VDEQSSSTLGLDTHEKVVVIVFEQIINVPISVKIICC
jgi:hypothetical protein